MKLKIALICTVVTISLHGQTFPTKTNELGKSGIQVRRTNSVPAATSKRVVAADSPEGKYLKLKSRRGELAKEYSKLWAEQGELNHFVTLAKKQGKTYPAEARRLGEIAKKVPQIKKEQEQVAYELARLELDHPELKRARK